MPSKTTPSPPCVRSRISCAIRLSARRISSGVSTVFPASALASAPSSPAALSSLLGPDAAGRFGSCSGRIAHTSHDLLPRLTGRSLKDAYADYRTRTICAGRHHLAVPPRAAARRPCRAVTARLHDAPPVPPRNSFSLLPRLPAAATSFTDERIRPDPVPHGDHEYCDLDHS